MEWPPVAACRGTNRGNHGEPDPPLQAAIDSTDYSGPERARCLMNSGETRMHLMITLALMLGLLPVALLGL
jgi:hypothetical protein